MTLSRRGFSSGIAGVALGGLLAPAAHAQTAPIEGTHYIRLAQPLPAAVAGKVEVIEFFWYECPHCNAFEPALDAWARRLPDDLAFRRVPVWFREEPFSPQQRLYYTLESLGLIPTLHRKVFAAIHVDRTRMHTAEDMAAFALKNGVDPVQFMSVYNSFSVQTKAKQARQTAEAYKIDSVPAMGVQGRYYTTGALASAGTPTISNERMLGVVDALIVKARQGARA